MNAPDTAKLNDALQAVLQQLDEATTAQALRKAEWTTAAAKGDDAKADKLEIEIEKTRRLMQRLELRRASLEHELGDAEEVARAAAAAKLKATADSILARAGKRIADMEPLAASLAKLVDDLESDFNDYKDARYFAQQAGATPEGFASQANDALVRRVTDSLSMSRIRASNIAKEMSRISVFH